MRDVYTVSTNMAPVDLTNIGLWVDAVKQDLMNMTTALNETKKLVEFLSLPHEEQRRKILDAVEYKYLVEDNITPIPEHLKDLYDFQKL